MKKTSILYIFILLSFTFFTSCDDSLNVKSISSLSDDVIFANPDLTEGAIAAVYDIIGQNNSYRNRLWLQMGVNTDLEYRSGWASGAVISSVKSDDYFALYNSNPTIGDGYNNSDDANPWSRIYQGIERSNLAISGIRTFGSPAAGNDMGHYLGEALTMRAFFYYDLIKWWGDVPARFEPLNSANMYAPKSDRDVIYNQIITDLQEAVTMLQPANSSHTKTVKRISKEAAEGLLARIALSAGGYSMRPLGTGDAVIKITATDQRRKELYTIARDACRAIINEGVYSLDASFKNIFFQQCQDIETHGREAIWELPYNMGGRGRMLYNLGLPRDADGVHNTVPVGGQFKVMPSFFYDYNVKDTRRDITVVPYKVAKNTISNYMQDTLSSGIIGFNLGKWRAEWIKTTISSTEDGVSPIVLRYSDVLLMYAEADLFLGATDGAEYFNMVRRRGFGQPVNVASTYDLPLTQDNIIQERAFEFCGENIRKYDLERWGLLKTKIDQAAANLTALRDGTGAYADVPATLYYKNVVDNTITPGEHVLVIYGLQRGETDDKTVTDPTGGWKKKSWTQATMSTGELYLSDGFISHMYLGNPDKRQLLPIMHQIIISSNGTLSNDYGYSN